MVFHQLLRTLFLPLTALVTFSPVSRLYTRIWRPTYTAGVVEFEPDTPQPNDTPEQVIMKNANRYVEIIKAAAINHVDILVFPEYGLTSTIPMVAKEAVPFMTEVPDIGVNPCDLKTAKVLKTLSCAARIHKLYVVFNLGEVVHCSDQPDCPADGFFLYNTNLALDRRGNIIAKYRKFNLFEEPIFSVTKEPQHSWFDTDFGVRFGMFICFDIMFLEPSYGLLSELKITNFVYSSQWIFLMPFTGPITVHSAWAYANNVNLLAAGYSDTPEKQGGSGIYGGRNGQLIATMPKQSSTKLLIANVSPLMRRVDPDTKQIRFTENKDTSLDVIQESLEGFTSVPLEGTSSHLEYDNQGFQCNIKVEFSVTGNGPIYRLVAFSGERLAFGMSFYVEVCGIVSCTDSTLSSCGGINIDFRSSKVEFSRISIVASSDKLLLSLPVTLDNDLTAIKNTPFKYESEEVGESHKISMTTTRPISNFMAFALLRNGSP